MNTLLDITHDGKIYRPFDRSMAKGWDKVKSGTMRPYAVIQGVERYIFPEGYMVIDAATNKRIDFVKKLPNEISDREGMHDHRPARAN